MNAYLLHINKTVYNHSLFQFRSIVYTLCYIYRLLAYDCVIENIYTVFILVVNITLSVAPIYTVYIVEDVHTCGFII